MAELIRWRRRRRQYRLRVAFAVLAVAAVVTCVLSMVTGLDHTVLNPNPGVA